MREHYSSGEYRGYEPGTLDENGHDTAYTDWEDERDKDVRRQIPHRRSLRGIDKKELVKQHRKNLKARRVAYVEAYPGQAKKEWRYRHAQRMVLAVGGIALALTTYAAFKDVNGTPSEGLSPNERFEYDYLEHESTCFEQSAYDITAGNQGKFSVSPPSTSYNAKTDILTITPVSGEDALHLEGFDQHSHRLTPVSEEDQAIFDSYNCAVKNY